MWHRSVPAEFPGQAVPDPGEVIYKRGVLPGHPSYRLILVLLDYSFFPRQSLRTFCERDASIRGKFQGAFIY